MEHYKCKKLIVTCILELITEAISRQPFSICSNAISGAFKTELILSSARKAI